MTRRVVPLLLSIIFALFTAQSAQAQRGGGHGGVAAAHFGAGHFGTGSRGSVSSPSLSRSPQIFRSPFASPGTAPLRSGGPAGYSPHGREPYRDRGNNGRYRAPYFYGYGAYLVPNVVGYPFGYGSFFDDDGSGYDQAEENSSAPPPPQETSASPGDYAPQPGPYPGPNEEPSAGYRPAYPNSGQIEPPRAQPATALIYQDGRPRELVHNYVLTKTTLYDLDTDSRKDIPLADLNLPATIAANRSAGIEFSLPAGY